MGFPAGSRNIIDRFPRGCVVGGSTHSTPGARRLAGTRRVIAVDGKTLRGSGVAHDPGRRLGRGHREGHLDEKPACGLRTGGDAGAVGVGDGLDDGEAEAEAFAAAGAVCG